LATPTADPDNEPDRPDPSTTNAAGEAQSGAALDLRADPAGRLHLLYRARSVAGRRIGYAYRAPGKSFWRTSEQFDGRVQYRGALGLLSQPDGRVKRFVALQTENAITLYTSLDGLGWSRASLPVGQYLNPEIIFSMTMVVAPRGPGLVAVT